MNLDDYYNARIAKVRDVMTVNFDDSDDDIVPLGALFEAGELTVIVLPTLGDGMLSVDVTGWVRDQQAFSETHTIFDKES